MLRKTQVRGATRSRSCKGSTVELKDYQEVAEAADMPTLESRLVRFANERYSMLETVRAFAEERLDHEDAATVRRRLRAYVGVWHSDGGQAG